MEGDQDFVCGRFYIKPAAGGFFGISKFSLIGLRIIIEGNSRVYRFPVYFRFNLVQSLGYKGGVGQNGNAYMIALVFDFFYLSQPFRGCACSAHVPGIGQR